MRLRENVDPRVLSMLIYKSRIRIVSAPCVKYGQHSFSNSKSIARRVSDLKEDVI